MIYSITFVNAPALFIILLHLMVNYPNKLTLQFDKIYPLFSMSIFLKDLIVKRIMIMSDWVILKEDCFPRKIMTFVYIILLEIINTSKQSHIISILNFFITLFTLLKTYKYSSKISYWIKAINKFKIKILYCII